MCYFCNLQAIFKTLSRSGWWLHNIIPIKNSLSYTQVLGTSPYKMYVYVCMRAQSCPTLCNPPQTEALQAPLSMGFPREEYWSGSPFPSLQGLKPASPGSPALQADSFLLSHWGSHKMYTLVLKVLKNQFGKKRKIFLPDLQGHAWLAQV